MKIYVLGNPLVQEDSLPLKMISDLKKAVPKVDFIAVDPNENFPPEGEKDLVILDTVKGIKKAMILDLNNFDDYKNTPISPHDYDLLFHLLLLKKLKKIDRITIVGVPSGEMKEEITDEVKKLIQDVIAT
jgi:Ni,Fe-hydrogenase maturation factor